MYVLCGCMPTYVKRQYRTLQKLLKIRNRENGISVGQVYHAGNFCSIFLHLGQLMTITMYI